MAKLIKGIPEHIKTFGAYVVSADTLDSKHLIHAFLKVLEPGTDDVQRILYNPLGRMNSDPDGVCNDLWDVMERIEVEGYWFGSNDYDPACIGWFKIEEDES